MMEYVFDEAEGGRRKYGFSYQELREEYHRYKAMTDKEFFSKKNLPAALHFACFVAFVKELGINATVGDEGIIHQLVHHLHIGDVDIIKDRRRETRRQFDDLLELK